MELLTYPKTDYLLSASLETLHAESREWLNEISFWKDELAFFYSLLHKEELRKDLPVADVAAVEKRMLHIGDNRLDKLEENVKKHEHTLAGLYQSNAFKGETSYRDKHKELLTEIYDVYVLIRGFKKDLFSFIEKYELS